MEDRPGGRVDVMPAVLAGVGGPGLDAVVGGDLGALVAQDAVRVEIVLQPFEAGVIVREVPAKLGPRGGAIAAAGPGGGVPISRSHNLHVGNKIHTFKVCFPCEKVSPIPKAAMKKPNEAVAERA